MPRPSEHNGLYGTSLICGLAPHLFEATTVRLDEYAHIAWSF